MAKGCYKKKEPDFPGSFLWFQILVEEFPKRVVQGWGSDDGDLFLFHRVGERDGSGMEADSTTFIGTGKTVFQVPFDGTSYLGQLATNLVMASRTKFYFQQIVTLDASQ